MHGGKNTKLYQVWCAMKQRCENQKSKHYKWYGAKGVAICAELKHDYASFRDWAYLNGYKEGLTIDRIDTSGNYSPQNCRWATKKEQANNQTTTIKLEYKGVEKPLHEWAESIGVKPHTLWSRIYRLGWSVERALTEKVSLNRYNREALKEREELC